MTVRKAGNGYGTLHQNSPIWDFGAFVYWVPRMGKLAQLRGGAMTEADDFNYTYSGAGTSLGDWMHFDGNSFREDTNPPTVLPFDGHFQPERLNTWNSSSDSSSDRGPFTRQTGLSLSLVTPPPSRHIIQNTTGAPNEMPVITNLTASAKRMYQRETTSSGNKKMWSMFFQRADGGKIDATTVTLGAATTADPLGADIGEGTTRYDKVRDDGWYRVSRSIPDQLGVDVYYFAEIAGSVTNLRYEAPQVETFSATIAEPTTPILTGASTRRRQKHLIELQGNYQLTESGWMAATVIPYTDAASLVAGVAPNLIQGDILTWYIDGSNRNRILWSATTETIKFQMTESGSTQADLDIPQAKVLQGVPLGIVVTWGKRAGASFVMLSVNGRQEDVIDTVNTAPQGAASIFIGANNTGGNVANAMIQAVACGNNVLSRGEVRTLSRWFETQSYSKLGKAGD